MDVYALILYTTVESFFWGGSVKKAALYVHGRVVIGDSHLQAYQQLAVCEKEDEDLISGFYNMETQEFQSDCLHDHFFNKEIFLIRHAQTERPTQDPDAPDPDLSPYGNLQAQDLAQRLAMEFNFGEFFVFSSPMLRCLRTAMSLQKTFNLKVSVCPNLSETPSFVEDGETFRLKNHSQIFPSFDWPTGDDFEFAYESQVEFLNRTKLALQELPERSILVTHFGVICNISRLALCDEKARVILQQGVQPASVAYINRKELTLHEDSNRD